MCRILLAALIAVAVAVAPVGFALASAQAMAKPAMEDCNDKKSGNDQSCCGDSKAQCPDVCGVKCCKLIGIVAALPAVGPFAYTLPNANNPQKPPDWQLRPRPPPPRT